MAALIASLDWSRSPLGPIESWPQSLRTTVSLCLASNFPINIIWGEGHNQIYNAGYRVVCGAVHPRAMGESYRVTWASAWPAIGEPFERALAGETSYLENQRMFLERNGYPEETFFTFSLSPIRDESGKVVGLFHPVTETTATMLAERRTRALRDIADSAGQALVFDEACGLLLATLGEYAFDLPFALLYVTSPDGTEARLQGQCGVPTGAPFTPDVIPLKDTGADGTWPLARAAKSGRVEQVTDLEARFGPVVAGPYPEPLKSSFVLPVRVAGVDAPLGYLVIGVSQRLPLEGPYRAFVEMLSGAVSAALGNARAYEAERRRAEALAEIDQAKTAFFSNVSHEFRTPLTLMLGPVEDLLAGLRGALPEAAHGELRVVHRNALRLLKLVNALLDFSRIEAGRAQAHVEPTDLSALTRDVASAFRSAIERAGMRLVVDAVPLEEPVFVDREMWEKIVLNLVSNAFKFTHAGEIRVELKREERFARLSVRDTGIGIPEPELGKVFQRFHRVTEARGRTHEGSGIGLALVHDLAKLHGGSVEVESVEGQGATFTVRVPFGRAFSMGLPAPEAERPPANPIRVEAFVEEALRWSVEPSEEALPVPAAPPDTAAPVLETGPRPRILLADDNADMRDYVRRLLSQRYDVTAVANGAEALRSARESRPDLVLSDVMMPVMDGIQLVKQLRADEALRTLPVILLSARAGEEATSSGLELGADDYLTKPFGAKELLARVRTQLTMAAMRLRSAEQDAHAEQLKQHQRGLEALLGARDEFLSIASHELKTPITSLLLQLQMAERNVKPVEGRTPNPERMARALKVSLVQVDRLTRLVEDLLDVARIRTGSFELAVQEVDLTQLASDVLERLSGQLAQTGCPATLEAPPKLVWAADLRRLEQVLTNLITNAMRYAPGGPLAVRLESRGDLVRLEVRDHGPGVPESQRDSIFDRFERGIASRHAGGLGLGLFISKQIIAAHGGRISVEGPPDGGACFVVLLPRSAAHAQAPGVLTFSGVL
ncbi:ATP-binding response regulator [Corallococcus exercitus]|uniref:histidine kinase n=1 Tax=Corallococcus exercitus TaxID=2316736 RepID=A0A7Y4NPN4_9BACT|nr:ATP-binding protein [Corallococcus exercitus]NOK31866.1 response regulator [Corallococcus exercitus]